MTRALPIIWLTFAGFLLGGCADREKEAELLVFAAASLADLMEDMGRAFTEETGIKVQFNFASSGALARQIEASARGDVFLSASERWMDSVQGALVVGSRTDLLTNRLVLVAHQNSAIGELGDEEMRFLAIGDPAHVPVGAYARAWLEAAGLWDRLSERLLLGPDARAVLAQTEGRMDVLGVVYRTDYLTRSDALRLLREVVPGQGWDIRYPVALLRDNQNTRAWLRFLKSDRAAGIYQAHGFEPLL